MELEKLQLLLYNTCHLLKNKYVKWNFLLECLFYLPGVNICHGVYLFCGIVWEALPFFCILDVFSSVLKKPSKTQANKKEGVSALTSFPYPHIERL